MAKRKTTKAVAVKTETTIVNAQTAEIPITNGLSDALGFPGGGSYPFNQGTGFSEQISNVNTIFKNLRWYLISNMRQPLSEAYVELGLVSAIVDIPVDDALRGGIDIKSKQLDEEQIEELQISIERDNDLAVAAQAGKWDRLFGGAGIIPITDQDPSTPLDISAIGKDTPLEFRAVDMWELFWSKQNTEDYSLAIDGNNMTENEFFDYYGIDLHHSRVLLLKGLTAPSFVRPRLRGWGYSVVEKLVRSINQYLKATDLGFEVMDEFKLDVYKIKNLVNTLMSPNGEAKVKQRVQMANWQKNYQNAIVMDSEDDFDHKQLSFAGLAEAMAGIRMQVASDMRMPMTKLFGISAAGFNSGEDDIEVYNSMIESEVRAKLKYHILKMVEIKCQKLFGMIPDDLKISFKPLRMMTSEQEENVKTQKFNRLLQAKTAGEVTTFEFRDACNKDGLLPVTLDTKGDKLNPDDSEVADVLEGKDAAVDAEEDGNGAGEAPAPKAAPIKKSPNAPKTKNSLEYDVKAYEADGGADRWSVWHKRQYDNPNPQKMNMSLLATAKEAAVKAFGKEVWQFALWYYEQHGGKLG